MAAVIAAASIFGLSYGLSAPLIAANLAQLGTSTVVIGFNAAMHAVGVLAIAPLLPRFAVAFGARPLMVAGLAMAAAALAIFPLLPVIAVWFVLRLALGVAAEILFVISETWTNDLADDRTRGRTMAVYTAALALGFAGGPAILSITGTVDTAYFVGAAIALAAIVPVANPWILPPKPTEPARVQPMQYLGLAPVAVGTAALNAAVETAGLSFIALYAAGMGWSEPRALQLVSALMLGAIVMQLPIGWLADRVDRRRLAIALAALATAGALAWPFMLGHPAVAFTAVFVWGGVFVGIYTVMLAIVGSRFSGGDLVGMYAIMSLAWGAGALVGPLVAGTAMHASPMFGLPYAIAAACAVFALFAAFARRRDQAS